MGKQPHVLLTIIVEAALQEPILKDLKRLGAEGYTVVEASGEGSRGVRSDSWDQSRNLRIEVIGEASVIEAIAKHLLDTYYANYAMMAYLSRIEVIGP